MSIFRDRFTREGSGRPAPETGWPRLAVMGLTHFWRLVGANLLFVLFSIPIVTLPAALCALNRVCVLIYRDGNLYLWQDFLEEFKRSFLRSLLPGLFFALLLFGAYFFLSLASGNAQVTMWFILFWAVGGVMLLTAICVGAYFFVLVSSLDLNNRDALKDALILVLARPARALLVFALVLGLSFIMAALLPIGFVLMLFFWFAFQQYLVSFLVYDLAEDLILLPYEAQKGMQHDTDDPDKS